VNSKGRTRTRNKPARRTAAWRPEAFRAILDDLREVVFATDAEGRFTFLSRSWERITGFTVAESLGRVFLEFVVPEERERYARQLAMLVEPGAGLWAGEAHVLTREGVRRWVQVQARAEARDGDSLIFVGLVKDITECGGAAGKLREAHQKLELVLTSSPAVLFAGVPSAPFRTTFVTGNVRAALGYEPAQFIAEPGFWFSLIHPGDVPAVRRCTEELVARGEAEYCARLRHRDGSYRSMRTTVRLVRDHPEAPLEVLGCVVDETGVRQAEEALGRNRAIHETIGFAAKRFLETGSWQAAIGEVLERLGCAAEVNRIRIAADLPGEGKAHCWEWAAPGIAVETWAPDFGADGPGSAVRAGANFHGLTRDLPEPLRSRLERAGVRSLAVVPIPFGHDIWGALAVADCVQERSWTEAEVGALKSMAGMLGATMHREASERALRYDEALLRTMADSSPAGLFVADNRTGRVLYSNDRFAEVWGLPLLSVRLRRGEMNHLEVVAICLPLVLDDAAFAAVCAPLRDERNRAEVEYHIALRDGRTIRFFSMQIRGAEDQYFGRLYQFEDVTAQRRAEGELRRSHDDLETRVAERTAELQAANSSLRVEIAERQRAEAALAAREAEFRALIENTLDVLVVLDPRGVVRYISPSVERVFGYSQEEILGCCGFEFVHPQDLEEVMERNRVLLEQGGSHRPVACRVRHKEGEWRVVEIDGNNQARNPALHGIILTLRDITERRRLEEQFRQAQKMEAVGRLAGGVAHDFNNLLTVIRGYSGLMAKRLAPGDPALRNLGQVQRASDRAAALVQQLLAFSRKQIVEPKVLDINAAVIELDRMLRRLIGEDVELTITGGSEPLYVRIDPNQLEQMVMNLSVNARDAMPDGGALTIAAGLHSPRSPLTCAQCKVFSGDWAVLSVADTGVGIPDDVRGHIFEPFFTTKEVGKGTGLGLSMVYGAVEQAGGHVCVESTPGQGSIFRICLPVAPRPQPQSGDDKDEPEPDGGSETILVAEDEELVRAMVGEALRRAGYRVIEAANGADAVAVLESSEGPVHLLLTDVVMPRMSGPALASKVAAVRPGIKVLYTSGYPRQELDPHAAFLRKPFTPDELVRQVRSVLDGHTGQRRRPRR
jgi:PAS domain S-box-containing protein